MPTYPMILALLMSGGLAAPIQPAPADCAPPAPAAVSSYFDSHVPGGLTGHRVPGAVVSVVSGDRTIFSKGYGTADAENGVPFDPARSLVRIASISKLFTWTAVMQQVQAGRLDLHADVNGYLTGFQVPRTYPQPVTLQNLMDHTSGFEDRIIGTAARTAAGVTPLGKYLAENMPARIRPPGVISAYSNYGAALAGYVVAEVSGQSYDAYVRQHLLDPLGMTHSTAGEPVPAALAPALARSYDSDERPVRRVPFTFDQLTPDGSISTTADDMARFMAAHLNDGGPLLSPATTALMHRRSFAAGPHLGGYAHGFMDRVLDGHHVLMHDGSWEGFESVMILVPGCHVGVFISTNATGGVDAVTPWIPGFLALLPAATDTLPAPAATTPGTVTGPAAGFYETTRHNESSVEKVVTLLGSPRLTTGADGTVHFKGKTWTRQADGGYASADGADHLTFLRATDGRQYVATDGPDYQLMGFGSRLTTNLAVLGAFVLIAVSALVVPLIGLARRRRPIGGRVVTGRWRLARRLSGAAAGLGLAYLVAVFAVLLGDTGDFLYAVPATFRVVLLMPFAVLLLGAAALVPTIRGWRGSGAGVVARAHHVAVLAAVAGVLWFSWQWNLIGWQF
jgi:CubicO group peptidase (beta-lactamase class C family)